jgi:predicted  nucleic acid-binding Zn-ribbon protein
MRKPLQIAGVTVIVVLLGATTVFFQKAQKSEAEYREAKAAEETARTHYAEAFNAIAEIQDSINAIVPDEASRRLRSDNLATEQRLNQPSREQALESIALLNASIQRTKERISSLEAKLKKSGVKMAGLQKMVANLKESVVEKEGRIAVLTTQVDSLQTQTTVLATQVQEHEVTIEEKRRELATVYVAVGSKKELKAQGVIDAKGGFLGLGKTVQPTGVATAAAYTPLDTDHETVVPIPAAKAKVISAQPPTSYQLTQGVDGKLELRITDPTEFRRVRQVVIVTA